MPNANACAMCGAVNAPFSRNALSPVLMSKSPTYHTTIMCGANAMNYPYFTRFLWNKLLALSIRLSFARCWPILARLCLPVYLIVIFFSLARFYFCLWIITLFSGAFTSIAWTNPYPDETLCVYMAFVRPNDRHQPKVDDCDEQNGKTAEKKTE